MKKHIFFIMMACMIICVAGCNNGDKKEPNIPDAGVVTQEPSNDDTKVNDVEQDIPKKEVISVDVMFTNGLLTYGEDEGYYKSPFHDASESYSADMNYGGKYSQVISAYGIDPNDDEQLCAFVVRRGQDSVGAMRIPKQEENESMLEYAYRTNGYIEDVLRQRGIYIIEDYPYCFNYRASRGLENFPDADYYNVYRHGCLHASFAVAGTMKDITELCKDCGLIDGWYLQFISAPRPDLVEVVGAEGDYGFWERPFQVLERMDMFGEEDSIIATVDVSKNS